MNKKVTVILLTALLLISFNVNASEELASETIKVIVNIDAFQEMEVIKPIRIENINNEFKNKSLDEPVIIENAGKIRVKSNAHWRLELNNTILQNGYDLKIKVGGSSVWKDVSRGATYISGENGDHLLSFDLKVIPNSNEMIKTEDTSINFNYTLVQI